MLLLLLSLAWLPPSSSFSPAARMPASRCRAPSHPHRLQPLMSAPTEPPPEEPESSSPLKLLSLTASEYVSTARDNAAFYLKVTPPWVDAMFGSVLFVVLNTIYLQTTLLMLPSPEADTIAARILALGTFAALQQFAGVPVSQWLRLGEDPSRVSRNPLFQSGTPLAGVTFAFLFAVPVAILAQLAGLAWLPEPRPWPEAEDAFLRLVVAPVSEECFFRAWLCAAFERAGGAPLAALVASSALYGLYQVPLSEVLNDGSPKLLLFEALGAYLVRPPAPPVPRDAPRHLDPHRTHERPFMHLRAHLPLGVLTCADVPVPTKWLEPAVRGRCPQHVQPDRGRAACSSGGLGAAVHAFHVR